MCCSAGRPARTAQLVSLAHVRILRPDNFPHSSPGPGGHDGSESVRFDFCILNSILGSLSGCQMRRPVLSAWLLLRGMRPVPTAHVRASDLASHAALFAPRELDLALPPLLGQTGVWAGAVAEKSETGRPLAQIASDFPPVMCTRWGGRLGARPDLILDLHTTSIVPAKYNIESDTIVYFINFDVFLS